MSNHTSSLMGLSTRTVLGVAALGGVFGGLSVAQGQCDLGKETASDAGVNDWFGTSMAMEGDWLAVGAPNWWCDESTPSCGAVYVYRRNQNGTPDDLGDDTWIEHDILAPASLVLGDSFGTSVAMSGDVIVAGVVGVDVLDALGSVVGESGGAFVFRRNDSGTPSDLSDDLWTQEALLSEDIPYEDARFGASVSVDGSVIAVGAPYDIVGASSCCVPNEGCVGDCANWVCNFQPQCCSGPWNASCVYTAAATDTSPSTNPCPCRNIVGAVYVFQNGGSGWSQTARLAPSDYDVTSRALGWSVSVSGSWIAAGTNGNAVYMYELGGGTTVQYVGQLEDQMFEGPPPSNGAGHSFGQSVSIDGDWMVTGDSGDDGDCTSNCDRGLLYVYRNVGGTWTLHETLEPATLGNQDRLGWPVLLKGDVILATAGNAAPVGCNSRPCGAVHMYRRDDAGSPGNLADDSWVESGFIAETPPRNTTGFSKSLAIDGSLAVVGASRDDEACCCGNFGNDDCGAFHTFAIGPDPDADTFPDACDNCPTGSNPEQTDTDTDGIGDVCEACCGVAGGGTDIRQFCIVGDSDGSGYSWRLSGPGYNFENLNPPVVSAGMGEEELVAAFVASINSSACDGAARVTGANAKCFFISLCGQGPFQLEVGQLGQEPDCVVTDVGCTYNPMIMDVGPIPTLSTWGAITTALLLLTAGALILNRRVVAKRTL